MSLPVLSQRLHSLKASLAVHLLATFEDTKAPAGLSAEFGDLSQVVSEDQSASGALFFYEAPKLEWIVDTQLYANAIAFATSRLTVWCDASVLVPHLVVEIATVGPKCMIYFDYLPRVDISVDPEYVEQYYGEAGTHRATLEKDDAFVAYASRSAYVNGLTSPAAMLFSFELNEETVSTIEVVMSKHVEQWCLWMDSAVETPVGLQPALQQRDRIIRRNAAYLDPDNGKAEALFGKQLTRRMLAGLAGPQS